MAVNRVNMRKWVRALRGGKYKQGRGQLYNPRNNTYCCLGVACVVAGIQQPRGIALPPDVRVWLGLEERDPSLAARTTCIDANDYRGWSFARIATALEKRYLSPVRKRA